MNDGIAQRLVFFIILGCFFIAREMQASRSLLELYTRIVGKWRKTSLFYSIWIMRSRSGQPHYLKETISLYLVYSAAVVEGEFCNLLKI